MHRPLFRRDAGQRPAVEEQFALVGRIETGDQAQDGGLAAARGAEQREELAGLDVERHFLESFERAEALGDPADFEQGHELPRRNRWSSEWSNYRRATAVDRGICLPPVAAGDGVEQEAAMSSAHLATEVASLLVYLGVPPADDGEIAVHTPIDGSCLGHWQRPPGTLDDMVAEARTAFLAWRDVPAPRRGQLVHGYGECLRRHKAA